MGTNYYLLVGQRPPCECCKRPYMMAKLHIGKSSYGWVFLLHVDVDEGIKTLEDWKVLINDPSNTIEDEYGSNISREKMLDIITNRSALERASVPAGYQSWDKFFHENNAMLGPNNLFRCKISEYHCIGHGEGTWDYIIGEFD